MQDAPQELAPHVGTNVNLGLINPWFYIWGCTVSEANYYSLEKPGFINPGLTLLQKRTLRKSPVHRWGQRPVIQGWHVSTWAADGQTRATWLLNYLPSNGGYHYTHWGVVEPPLKKIRVRQLGWWHFQYMEKKTCSKAPTSLWWWLIVVSDG